MLSKPPLDKNILYVLFDPSTMSTQDFSAHWFLDNTQLGSLEYILTFFLTKELPELMYLYTLQYPPLKLNRHVKSCYINQFMLDLVTSLQQNHHGNNTFPVVKSC